MIVSPVSAAASDVRNEDTLALQISHGRLEGLSNVERVSKLCTHL